MPTALALGALLLLSSAAAGGPTPAPDGAGHLRVQVLETLPHDASAFTQGLEFAGPVLYESTGLVGRSTVSAGPPGRPASVRKALGGGLFGEGITVVGDRLWQLTWKDGVAIERDRATLTERRRVAFSGEGWGLCHQRGAARLVVSDGSSRLTFRDRDTFAVTGHVNVTLDGTPLGRLNELECTPDGAVWANVFPRDTIVRVDPDTGAVTATVDAADLFPAHRRPSRKAVLNGIAAVPGTDEFVVTGKLWPHLFRVRFIPRAAVRG
ncbi:glutaminyl-peptide cyclotransferase [Streptomyces purpureus]|uniref:glutaminyl-peptide cyclotransferase n=1 Tax=Streptomyces purpureus TaxID=1951 RepID=UPI00036D677C|nr:glutaminyl-peptide cyclotransferase [Streptomyces purpureus]